MDNALYRKKYVVLDRDGTIIVNKHYQKDPAETELLPNAREGLDRLREAGYGLVMVTNQSGIGRGYLSRADLASVNRSVIGALAGGDDYFEGIYYCPHVDADNCGCRKPKPGLLHLAAADLGFDMRDSFVVGDREIDVMMGKAAGARTVLVRSGYGGEVEKEGQVRPDHVADDLLAAAEWIIAQG